MGRRSALLGGLLPLLLAACAAEPIDPSPEGVYLAKCSRCHEVDGSSTTATRQAGHRVDLRDRAFQKSHSDAELRRIAVFGTGKMQGVPGLSEERLDSLVVHLRRLGGASRP